MRERPEWRFSGYPGRTFGLARSPLDLDGDGIADLVWSKQAPTGDPKEPPWILAVSGKTGKVLWFYYVHNEAKPGTHQLEFGAPRVAEGDGAAAMVMAYRVRDGADRGHPQAFVHHETVLVEAISASTGKLLWRSVPVTERTTDMSRALPFEEDKLALATRVMHVGERAVVAVVAENTVATFDLKTGQAASEKQELPKPVTGMPQFFDGDDPSVLVVVDGSYVLRSLLSGKQQWRWAIPLHQPKDEKANRRDLEWEPGQPQWPLIADLDGGATQSLILMRCTNSIRNSLGVELVDLTTGRARWTYDRARSFF